LNYTTLIAAEDLQTLITDGTRLMVFDCSFELMKPQSGGQQFSDSHIPGAVRADLALHLSATDGAETASGGRHPLPTRKAFAVWLGSIGFGNDMQAVVYDRQGANYCGRLWWMLKWAGHENVALLDGGLEAWHEAGGVVTSGPATEHKSRTFTLAPELAALVSAAGILKGLGRPSQSLVDARANVRFRGEVEPLDPIAGHIPGALNRPFGQNIGANGKFKSPAELNAEFTLLLAGRNPATVVHHCGSGVSAVPNIIAMEVAGLGRSALYAGSWSDWSSDPERPVAQG
jgi:thiosulfate/3-mercaptopyruvate sulfurtransferase